jgi:hypothetical protein
MFLEMALDKESNLTPTMSIKDRKKMRIIAIDIKLKDMSIFHCFSPSSHIRYCSNDFLVFFLLGIFFYIRLGSELLVVFNRHQALFIWYSRVKLEMMSYCFGYK